MIDISDYSEAEAPLRFFEEFSRIPHGSGNTKMIADYLVDFARARSLEVLRDEYDNVLIRKPATRGYESRPGIIFQGHLDMVAEKKPGAETDMTTDGLTLYRDGDYLRARNTTLGGDDGVALAYALAVLDDDNIPHPSFEALFTSDEETGLIGATNLSPEWVKGRLLINIDSDLEGIFTVGCAGGVRSDIELHCEREERSTHEVYKLFFSGFKGGHSGVEIDKGRVNAIKALTEALKECGVTVVSINGGNADNAIPRDVSCSLLFDDKEKLISALEGIKSKYADIEPDICYTLDIAKEECEPMTKNSSDRVISLLSELPSGVIAMCKSPEGLVETSLNLGILRCSYDTLSASFSVRSAKGKEKKALCERLSIIAKKYGASYGERGEYPAWEYREKSHLSDVMAKIYNDMYGKAPDIVIIHAGLECGILSEKLEGLDCVSIGPDNYDIHTTEEHLSIPSFARVWEFLKKVLSEV